MIPEDDELNFAVPQEAPPRRPRAPRRAPVVHADDVFRDLAPFMFAIVVGLVAIGTAGIFQNSLHPQQQTQQTQQANNPRRNYVAGSEERERGSAGNPSYGGGSNDSSATAIGGEEGQTSENQVGISAQDQV